MVAWTCRVLFVGLVVVVSAACVPETPEDVPVAFDESASLAGADANGDGIRDDVERVIAHAGTTAEGTAVLRRHAQGLRSLLALDLASTSSDDAVRQVTAILDASGEQCMPGWEEPELIDALVKVDAVYRNTEARRVQLSAIGDLMEGQSIEAGGCGR